MLILGDTTGIKTQSLPPGCSYQMREADKNKQTKNNYTLPELIVKLSKVCGYKINT